MNDKITSEAKNRSLVVQLLGWVVAMFSFGFFVLPPLYNVFCEITGFGGRTNTAAATVVETPDVNRTVRVEFVTSVNEYAPWEFTADTSSMDVHPGQMYYATFTAKNLTEVSKVAQAVPSISPIVASGHFKKIECFCFTSQDFSAHEQKEMPVQFILDTELPDYIDTVTLQYTFFDTQRVAAAN
ncbi:MAG TPA: cytochrome c oxidase assembly protein [Woeseiaceae bacterium]|nr:cytochrome c oxidase assembly protein [Woeseiaceae bacterium]